MEAALSKHAGAVRQTPSHPAPSYDRRRSDREAALPFAAISASDALNLRVREVVPRPRSELVTRLVNVGIASLALMAAAPIMAVIAVIVKATSPGPIMYSQIRVGVDRRWGRRGTDGRRQRDLGGKLFRLYKFRSMHLDAEPDGKAIWAEKNDPRVTAVGGLLRATRLDELPQLYNVLRGDMNIVGPRPERPEIFAELREYIPEYALRQRVKPGITGWAQVNQAYDTCIDDVRSKVGFDLEYIEQQSLGLDLRIMSRTIPVMLLRRGW